MFNITNHQTNADQNHNEIYHLTPVRMAIIKKTATQMLGQCGEEGTLVHYWWECKTVAATIEQSMKVPQKTKKRTTIWFSSSTPEYISKENKTLIWKDTCTPKFTAALFTIAKIWKQLKCTSTDECIKKMWIISYTHNGLLVIKKDENLQQHVWTCRLLCL